MTFSKTPPSTPGFYAWRMHPLGVAVAAVVSWNSRLMAFDCQLSDAAIGRVDRMGGEWCHLVPAEELLNMRDEFAELIWRKSLSFETAWELSRAKRVMEGKE